MTRCIPAFWLKMSSWTVPYVALVLVPLKENAGLRSSCEDTISHAGIQIF